MGNLLVRNLSDDTIRRLKERAARHGRSVEAEHRAVLEEAMTPVRTGADLVRDLMSGDGYFEDDELPVRDRRPGEPADFS